MVRMLVARCGRLAHFVRAHYCQRIVVPQEAAMQRRVEMRMGRAVKARRHVDYGRSCGLRYDAVLEGGAIKRPAKNDQRASETMAGFTSCYDAPRTGLPRRTALSRRS